MEQVDQLYFELLDDCGYVFSDDSESAMIMCFANVVKELRTIQALLKGTDGNNDEQSDDATDVKGYQ